MKIPQPSPEQKRAIVRYLRKTTAMRVIEKRRKEAEDKKKQNIS